MIREKISQGSFYDMLWKTFLPEDHELVRMKKEFNFEWIDLELEKYYSSTPEGRPPYAPRAMFLMLFLEFYENLSDHQITERTRYNALYRYFVGLGLEEEVPDYSTLSVFRKRVGEEGFKKLFNRFVEELKNQGLISHRLKIVDATHMEADSKVRSKVGILRQAQRKILSAMKRENARKLKKLLPEEPEVHDPKPEEEEDLSLLEKELEKLSQLLSLARGKFNYASRVQMTADMIEELLLNSEKSIGSLTDTDARFGHKREDEPFHGYKVHTVTNESEIVTTVETLPGNVYEGGDLPKLLKEEEIRDIPGEIVLADGLYASGENRHAIREDKELKMKEIIPAHDKVAQVDKFIYDSRTDSLICPNGNTAIAPSPHVNGKLFYFSKQDCLICPLQSQCPSFSIREGRARVFLSLDRQLRSTLSLSPQTQKALYRFRAIVERIYGKAKHWHGFARARYRGRWRVAIQSFLTFFVLNAKKALRIKEGLCPLKPPGLAALGYN